MDYTYKLNNVDIIQLRNKISVIASHVDINVIMKRCIEFSNKYPTKIDIIRDWFKNKMQLNDIPKLLYGSDELLIAYITSSYELDKIVEFEDDFNFYILKYGNIVPKTDDSGLNTLLGNILILCDSNIDIGANKKTLLQFLHMIPSDCYKDITLLLDNMKVNGLLELHNLRYVLYNVIKTLKREEVTKESAIIDVKNMIYKFNGFIDNHKDFNYDNFTSELYNEYKFDY